MNVSFLPVLGIITCPILRASGMSVVHRNSYCTSWPLADKMIDIAATGLQC